jgi:uncharacterized protein YraI
MVAVMLALVCSGFAHVAEPVSAAAYRTTAGVNLREGPSTSFAVIKVIPSGATVEVTGEGQFGFLPVTHGGSSGWASADYLTTGNTSSNGSSNSASGPTGTRYVVDGRLNLRNGPGTSYGVVLVLPGGAAVTLTGEVSNGFSKLTYNGTTGWAATQYLAASAGSNSGSNSGNPSSGSTAIGDTVTGTAYTTGRLNMRSGPSTSNGVRLVIPNGAKVDVMGSAQSGFTPVRYNGTKGWASSGYLTGSAPGGSTSNPGSNSGSTTVIDTLVATANVNMRTGPGTSYQVVRVVASGTEVGVTGSAQGGFVPVKVGSQTGFISASFLGEPGSAPGNPPANPSGDQEIINIIYAAADRWGQPRADMLRVARCESNLNPNAVNRSSGASGLFQFMPSTFAFTPNGKAGESIFNAYSSADAAGWMWANGMRNHWSCQ